MGDSPVKEQVPRYLAAAADRLDRGARATPRLRLAGVLLMSIGAAGIPAFHLSAPSTTVVAILLRPTIYLLCILAFLVGVRALVAFRTDLDTISAQRKRLREIETLWQAFGGLPRKADGIAVGGPTLPVKDRRKRQARDEKPIISTD